VKPRSESEAWARMMQKRALDKARWASLPTIKCSCGAEWNGAATEDNPVIDAHRQRASCHVTTEPSGAVCK